MFLAVCYWFIVLIFCFAKKCSLREGVEEDSEHLSKGSEEFDSEIINTNEDPAVRRGMKPTVQYRRQAPSFEIPTDFLIIIKS